MDERGWPSFLHRLPVADVPVPGLDARIVDDGTVQVAIFEFRDRAEVPVHSHADKWGIVVTGVMELTVGGEQRAVGVGDSYFIPSGVLHGATVAPGTRVIEVFAEHRFDLASGGHP